MNYSQFGDFGMMGAVAPAFGSMVVLLIAWSLLWKGLALWRAAKRGDKWWFIAFLVINTLGILEIVYLFAVTGAKISDFTGNSGEQPKQN